MRVGKWENKGGTRNPRVCEFIIIWDCAAEGREEVGAAMEGERPSLRDGTGQDAPNPSEQGSSIHVQAIQRRSTRNRKHTLLDSVLLERYPFQTQVRALVQNPAYENFILVLVLINCVLLAIFNPSRITAETKAKLDTVETAFLLTFTLEALLYIIAFGLVRFNNSYLRNGWTILDGVVVVIGGDGE